MSIRPIPPAGTAPEHLRLLFTPGARLGWVFRDRTKLAVPYPEPEPDPRAMQRQAAGQAAAAEARSVRAWRWLGKPSLALAIIFAVLIGYEKTINHRAGIVGTVVAAVVLCVPGLAYTAWCWARRLQAGTIDPGQEYRRALLGWQQRAAAHAQAERTQMEQVPQWRSAEPRTRHIDVFGGSLAGWQALLTTHGASILAAQPLLVLDLTGQHAAAELTATARAARVPTARYVLPADLQRCGLLAGLSPSQLAAAVAEAIHAGTPGGARADRAVDVRVLGQLAAALEGGVTPARLAAATQAALGHPVPDGLLTARETELIAGDLFPAAYRQQIGPNLVRLDAVLAELARHARYTGHATARPSGPSYYTCLAMESSARGAASEVLTALMVQWLTVQVSASTASAPAVIIAGADEITRPHLERLADACERRGVPLTRMFRHLRDDSLGTLGGGATAFMRLGNHAEAEQAASYIGRHHSFVLSQLTATNGGNQTATGTGTGSHGTTNSTSLASTRSWQQNPLGSGGQTRSRGTSTSESWSTAWSQADGTSWSDATTTQRVYEYRVEPAVLQNLPDYALLLVTRGSSGPGLQAVECNPAIITLPRVSTTPLPPGPARIRTTLPDLAQPAWPPPRPPAGPSR
jgi:hypothetical protein